MRISKADLQRNYEKLDVHFDLWLGESDAQADIPPMLEAMKARGIITESEGALVVEVQQPEDTKEVPPCILVKSDGCVPLCHH